MEQDLSLLIVFAAGLLSFLSPCVVPLIPGYIAFVSGISIDEITGLSFLISVIVVCLLFVICDLEFLTQI
jgi:cytochrome c-type biogenesis protein